MWHLLYGREEEASPLGRPGSPFNDSDGDWNRQAWDWSTRRRVSPPRLAFPDPLAFYVSRPLAFLKLAVLLPQSLSLPTATAASS